MSDDILHGEQLLHELYRKDAERARRKVTEKPLELTDHDFVALHNAGTEGEAGKAWEARRAAQLAPVREHEAAPLKTKSAASAPTRRPAWTAKEMSTMADLIVDTIKAALAKPQAEIEALKSRVLELEAQAAARRTVEHVDH